MFVAIENLGAIYKFSQNDLSPVLGKVLVTARQGQESVS